MKHCSSLKWFFG